MSLLRIEIWTRRPVRNLFALNISRDPDNDPLRHHNNGGRGHNPFAHAIPCRAIGVALARNALALPVIRAAHDSLGGCSIRDARSPLLISTPPARFGGGNHNCNSLARATCPQTPQLPVPLWSKALLSKWTLWGIVAVSSHPPEGLSRAGFRRLSRPNPRARKMLRVCMSFAVSSCRGGRSCNMRSGAPPLAISYLFIAAQLQVASTSSPRFL